MIQYENEYNNLKAFEIEPNKCEYLNGTNSR